MSIFTFATFLGQVLDVLGISIMVIGIFIATAQFLRQYVFFKKIDDLLYKKYRANLGRAILLGLEVIVGGDIIRSVVGQPDFTTVGLLVSIILIRTFLSITFDMEVEGKWPWKKS